MCRLLKIKIAEEHMPLLKRGDITDFKELSPMGEVGLVEPGIHNAKTSSELSQGFF